MDIIRFGLLGKIAWSDFFDRRGLVGNNDLHINAAIEWLSLAQDSSDDDGVSEGYHFLHGWLPSYPETTGYIIETFLDCHAINGEKRLRERALRMADWLVSIQNSDGSILDSYFENKMVFDTGMVIFGFSRAYHETGDEKYRRAAIRAADWLLEVQEENGSWIQYASDNIPHAYYSRVAWSLLTVHAITGIEKYRESCISNIEWCLIQQHKDGWFDNASFNLRNHHRPFTHTIAYTLRGILESGIYLDEGRYIDAVQLSLDSLMLHIKADAFVAGTYGERWNGDKRFNCLTGNAQLAIIFNKLYVTTGNHDYLDTAIAMNTYLKQRQELRAENRNIHGALAGSYPVWGAYIHYCYPNWASKFLAESLLIENRALEMKS